MRIQSTFVHFSSAAALLGLTAALIIGGNSTSVSAQATMAATMSSGTMMSGTMAAAMGTQNAIPPCPTGIMAPTQSMMSTMAATMMGTMSAPAMTMAATMAAPAMTMAATMGSMSATMAPTMAMTVVSGMSMNGCELSAKLTGAADQGSGKPGATGGSGSVTLMLSHPATGTGEICFNYQVSGITLPAVASHIHAGAAGVAGPVVVPFTGSDASGKASGCTENVPAALIDSILANPSGYYVNVHTTDFPGGAVRGQLSATAQ